MGVATASKVQTYLVGMGESVLLRSDETARAVVGSCVGLVLYHRREKMAAMAHIVLPEAAGRPGLAGKFADTAIPHMVDLIGKQGANMGGLVAMLAGGAQMFGKQGPLQIGEANTAAVIAAVESLGITIRGTSVGGGKGRRVSFDCATGVLTVEVAGEPPLAL
jgi:chemotaxis protein CheD